MSKHGRLIDADALGNRMYHEAFEKDSEDQKWDSGCWIRYKLFERVLREQPTIEPEWKNRLVKEIEDKTPEETYDFLSWLMVDYGSQFTHTRQAVIEWLRGEK